MDSFERSETAQKWVISVASFFVLLYGIWVMRLLRDNFQMPKEDSNGKTLRRGSCKWILIFFLIFF